MSEREAHHYRCTTCRQEFVSPVVISRCMMCGGDVVCVLRVAEDAPLKSSGGFVPQNWLNDELI